MVSGYYDITSKTLGKGHYGVVKLGRHCLTGEPVAIKVIEKARLNNECLNQLGTEIKILFRLSEYEHPNILKLYQTIDTKSRLFLITEYCGPHACDLHDYLLKKRSRNGLNEREAKIFFVQICSAISYCHSMGIVHRDLKPENILVTDKSVQTIPNNVYSHYPLLKLIDFGFANEWYPDAKMRTSCGTLAYSAPELLLGEPYDGTKVDVWGLGLMLYILIYGGNPFMQINDNETLTKILDCSFATPLRSNVDGNVIELLRSLIKRNPEARLPIDTILKHRWFSDVAKPMEMTLKCSLNSPDQSTSAYRPTSPDVEGGSTLSEEERKIHDSVIQEMFKQNNSNDSSKSSIEASLKNARFLHRSFNANSIERCVLGGASGSLSSEVASSIMSGDSQQQAPQATRSSTPHHDNDDYIYATYQLTRDKLLRFGNEFRDATYNSYGGVGAGGGGGDHHSSVSSCNNDNSSSVSSSSDNYLISLPLARKCSLVSEEMEGGK